MSTHLQSLFKHTNNPYLQFPPSMSQLKRAWNSGFNPWMGKRAALKKNISNDLEKRAWNSGFTGGIGKRAWNSGFISNISMHPIFT